VLLELLHIHIFTATKHVTLGITITAQLMQLNHLAECDEAHEGSGRNETKRELERLLECLQVVLILTSVHHKQENHRSSP
jgi:hypothetical protein